MSSTSNLLTIEETAGVLILLPKGDTTQFADADVDVAVKDVHQMIDSRDAPRLVMDLGTSRSYGSLIIGMMIDFSKRVRGRKGKLALCCLSKDMQQILEVMKLDQHFAIYPTREEALAAVNS